MSPRDRRRPLVFSVALLLGLAGVASYEVHFTTQQAMELERAKRVITALERELAALRRDHAALSRDLATATEQFAALPVSTSVLPPSDTTWRNHAELNAWVTDTKRLKRLLDERTEQWIPELQLLKEFDWLRLTRRADLVTEKGVRRALADIRSAAKQKFAAQLNSAVQKYRASGHKDAPPNVLALAPYLDAPMGRTVLERFEIADLARISPIDVTTGRLMESPWRIWEKKPIDAEYDLRVTVVSNGNVSLARSW